MTVLRLKNSKDRTPEQDDTMAWLQDTGAIVKTGAIAGDYSEYKVLDDSITTALSKSNLVYEGPTEPVVNPVRVALVPAEDRMPEEDDLIRSLGFTGELVDMFSYEKDGVRVGHYYDVFSTEAYDKLDNAGLILVTEGRFTGEEQEEPVSGGPEEALTSDFTPFDITGLLTRYSEAGLTYAHDNEFFQAYNVEVSSGDAETVTNDQGGRQSYQPGAFELLPPIAVTEVAKVLEHGATKYEAWNWTLIPSHMHLRSAMGHLFSFVAGDLTEGNDRFNHLTHAATRILFAVEMYARETGRYNKAK